MTTITENDVEQLAIGWLGDVGWHTINGVEIAPETSNAERDGFEVIVLERRLRDTLQRLNPDLGIEALEDAYRKLTNPNGTSVELKNESFHRMLVDGVNVEYRDVDRRIHGGQVKVIDFDDAVANDFLAVNQFAVVENKNSRRPGYRSVCEWGCRWGSSS